MHQIAIREPTLAWPRVEAETYLPCRLSGQQLASCHLLDFTIDLSMSNKQCFIHNSMVIGRVLAVFKCYVALRKVLNQFLRFTRNRGTGSLSMYLCGSIF